MWSKCNGMGKKGGSVKKVVKTKAYPAIFDASHPSGRPSKKIPYNFKRITSLLIINVKPIIFEILSTCIIRGIKRLNGSQQWPIEKTDICLIKLNKSLTHLYHHRANN